MFEEWLNEFDFSKGGIDFLEMFAKPEDSQGLLDIGLVLRNGHLMFLHLALNLRNLTACRDLPVLHDDISNPTARDNHDGNAEKDKGRKPKAGSAFFTVHFFNGKRFKFAPQHVVVSSGIWDCGRLPGFRERLPCGSKVGNNNRDWVGEPATRDDRSRPSTNRGMSV